MVTRLVTRSICGSKQRLAGNSVEVLATNLGEPAELIEEFPRLDVVITPK